MSVTDEQRAQIAVKLAVEFASRMLRHVGAENVAISFETGDKTQVHTFGDRVKMDNAIIQFAAHLMQERSKEVSE